MRHYTSEQWADYVRGASTKRMRADMKRHLESGCKKCEQAAGMWTTILTLAHQETGYKPPDSVVRLAKSYFAMCGIEGKESLIPRVARLVFDSLRQPQVAGVRSSGALPRHYVYRSGSMLVDVWMEPASESSPIVLTGQVLDQSVSAQAVQDMVVKLKGGDKEVTATTTNQFGEFHLEVLPTAGPGLQLTIGNDNKVAVIIPLGLIGVAPAGPSD